jgi:hypothetical protein
MGVSMKVGSKVTIPVLAGWTVASSDSAVIAASITAGNAVLECRKLGKATLTLALAPDLSVALEVTVTAA